VCREVSSSLVEAHEVGIVHRDIKPANIFLCSGPSWPIVKVLDFGIAGAVDPGARTRRLTLTGTVIGSASYMSPEQAQGKAVAPATDLYALGTVLFEMLAGKPPFDGLVFTAQLLAKVMQPAPGLRAVCPGLEVPTALHALVAELLERDPTRRPASARQLCERIEALLATASLPPLARAATERRAPPSAGAAKTEAMVPPTVDQGWAPRRTENAAPPRQRTRPRGLLRWALAAPVPMAAVFVWWTLRPQPTDTQQALALLPAPSAEETPSQVAVAPEPSPADVAAGALAGGADTPSEEPRELEGSRGAQRRASLSGIPEAAAAEARDTPPEVVAVVPQAASAPGAPSEAAPDEAAPAPQASAPATSEQGAVTPQAAPASAANVPSSAAAPALARLSTVAAAVRAERAGEITPVQRNDIIAALRRQRYDARARAAADFRAGQIDRQELKARQRAIDRRYEGR